MMSTERAREVIDGAGASVRDVLLPGDAPGDRRMGSLELVRLPDGSVDVRAWDYGISETLVRTKGLEEAVDHVVARWGRTPAEARPVSRADLEAWCRETAAQVESLAAGLTAGPVATQLVPGMVVDRFGNLDGFLLYPAMLPMAQRSLPPTVIDATRPQSGLSFFGVVAPVAVIANVLQPAFGQPGGGVAFKLAERSDTVRDLVQRDELEPLVVTEATS
jgi:hypothetical protein